MKYLYFVILRILLFIFSIIPLRGIYILSNFLVFILYYILPYRRKIIVMNLKNSFPEKSDKEINKLIKKIYRNFTDVMLETIKGFAISPKKLLSRYKITNPELADKYFDEGRSIILSASHYCNWEWSLITFPDLFKHFVAGIYKPFSNKYIDKYIRDYRTSNNMCVVAMNETGLFFKKQVGQKPFAMGMIADQSPSNREKAVWVKFLNQDTACIHGIDFYSLRYKLPVIHVDIRRVKRGMYEMQLVLLADPLETKYELGDITGLYMQKLEEIIKREPENWLWSHRRWKHSRADKN